MTSVFYWGPFIDNKIATVKAIYNSAVESTDIPINLKLKL